MFLDEIRGKTRSQWMLSTLISTDVAPPPISIDLLKAWVAFGEVKVVSNSPARRRGILKA